MCQDEAGSRGAAEAAFGSAMLRGGGAGGWAQHVVLDRCSADAADRAAWLALALHGKRDKGERRWGLVCQLQTQSRAPAVCACWCLSG